MEWIAVKKCLDVLEPFYKYTLRLQSQSHTLSDFYGNWLHISIKLKKMPDSELKRIIIDEMEARQVMLLDNPVMISAVFLDPRFQRTLNDEQKKLAIFFLTGVYQKITNLEKSTSESPGQDNARNENADNVDNSDSFEEMTSFLNAIPHGSSDNQVCCNTTEVLEKFVGVTADVKTSILQYWKEKEDEQVLYKLSQVIFSVPPTQTTVERAFSALGLILTPLRTRISDQNLQNILIVRLNHGILEEVHINDDYANCYTDDE